MVTISNFESSVPYKILKRGNIYYESGAVTELKEETPGKWTAIVKGTFDYCVNVSLRSGNIESCSCNCPFEGEMCKHEVAVLFAIRDYLVNGVVNTVAMQKADSTVCINEFSKYDFKKVDFDQLLMLATPAELKQFISKFVSLDEKLKKVLFEFLIDRHLNPSDTEEDYKEEVTMAFEDSIDDVRLNFSDDYDYDWDIIVSNVSALITKANLLEECGNPIGTISIAIQIIHSMGLMYENYTDYERDYLSDYCEMLGNIIVKAADRPDVSPDQLEEFIFKLNQIANIKCFSNYKLFNIEDLVEQINAYTQPIGKRLKLIDDLLMKNEDSYKTSDLVLQKTSLLEKMSEFEKVEETMHKYIHIYEIRKAEVLRLIENNRYDDAIKILNEGIELSYQEDNTSDEIDWTEMKLDIYKSLDDKDNIIAMYRRLFILGNGILNYYRKLKTLVPNEQWKDFLDEMMQETNFNKNRSYYNIEAEIYAEEKDDKRLFKLLSSIKSDNLNMLMEYSYYLKDDYSKQLVKKYVTDLKDYAENNVGRNSYEFIASALLCMKKLKKGEDAMNRLVMDFRRKYKRRPTMMAVLSDF